MKSIQRKSSAGIRFSVEIVIVFLLGMLVGNKLDSNILIQSQEEEIVITEEIKTSEKQCVPNKPIIQNAVKSEKLIAATMVARKAVKSDILKPEECCIAKEDSGVINYRNDDSTFPGVINDFLRFKPPRKNDFYDTS